MRATRMGSLVVIAVLAGCQESNAPTGLPAGGGPSLAVVQAGKGGQNVFEFSRFAGNDVTGAAGRIRDQNSAGAAWQVAKAEAKLDLSGELTVKVEGLVLKSSGVNPVAAFKAILSCVTPSSGALVNVNLSTATVPASPEGNAVIRETLIGIPSPCFAPIVFVTNAGGSWFAVSGG